MIPKIDIPCFTWNSQAEQGLLFFKAKSLLLLKKDMDISELQRIYAGHPNTKGLAALLEDSSVRTIFLGGLYAVSYTHLTFFA